MVTAAFVPWVEQLGDGQGAGSAPSGVLLLAQMRTV
jgi:hypothetical protein